MPTHKPVPLRALFQGDDSALSRLVGKANSFNELTDLIRQFLPPDLAPHLVATALDADQLVLIADSAVWAARLRFHAPDILIRLEREKGPGAHSVKVKVRGPVRPPDVP